MHARHRAAVAVVLIAPIVGAAGGCAAPARVAAAGTAAAQVVAATDRSVSFVHVPAHRRGQRLAAALLLPGSGPTDRNGDEPAQNFDPQTLKLIAGVLGRQGIMTLRFDKYFTGQTGGGVYADDPGRIDIAAFIRQADAAASYERILALKHKLGLT